MQTLEPIDLILQRLETQMKTAWTNDICKLQMYLSPEAAELLGSQSITIVSQLVKAVGTFHPTHDVLVGSHELVREISNCIDSQATCNVVTDLTDTGTIAIISLKRECPPFESQRAPLVTAFLVKGTVRVCIYTD